MDTKGDFRDNMSVPELGLSSRETAVGFWLAVLLLVALAHGELRSSLVQLVRTALSPALVIPLSLMAAYTAAAAWALSHVGLWTISLAKDTVIWFVVAGVAFAFRAATADNHEAVLRSWIRDSIAVIVVLEFLLGRYTLPLPAELIAIPVFTALAMLGVVAESDPRYRQVVAITGFAQIGLALPIFAYVIASVVSDFANLTTLAAVRELLLAPLLSIACVPFAYLLRVFVGYDSLLRRLGWRRRLPLRVWTYAAIRLLRHLGLRPHRVQRFIRHHGLRIPHVQSRTEVDDLIRDDLVDETFRPAA